MTTALPYDEDDHGLFTNKSTMMANFEEWIKMATDNKINSRNSWNFALIDYFHDLNVLKDEADNINFQKASATLDGCVKIYSHRVDSVATETGKLLSGLTERKKKQSRNNGTGQNDGENEDDSDSYHDDSLEIDPLTGLPISRDDPETLAKKKRTYNRVLETTLVDFESIRLKDLALSLSIDPLFKKALADFDEGGAKSLLINTLHVDDKLRVVFDATTTEPEQEHVGPSVTTHSDKENTENFTETDKHTTEVTAPDSEKDSVNGDVMDLTPDTSVNLMEDDILDLGIKFLDFNTIETSTICPSMDQLQSAVSDIGKAKSFVEGVNGQSDKFLTDKELATLPEIDPDVDFNCEMPPVDDADIRGGGGSIDYDAFGDEIQQSENELAQTSQQNISQTDDKSYADASVLDQELLSYFDVAIGQNWRGREHWKVRNIREKINKVSATKTQQPTDPTENVEQVTDKKIPKKQFEIDFLDLNDDIEQEIFATKKGFIELPIKQRTNDSHFLLPNDYKFTTDKITKLFIKPDQKMSFFSHRKNSRTRPPGSLKFDDTETKEVSNIPEIADENFWAENYQLHEKGEEEKHDETQVDKSTNPSFEDDNGIDFNQAFEDEDLEMDPKEDLIDTQGILSNNKVAYSRTSKKVDVRKLKNNVWKSISRRLHVLTSEEQVEEEPQLAAESEPQKVQNNSDAVPAEQEPTTKEEVYDLRFTEIAHDIVNMYSAGAKKDLSTSFCFICLLHLANEYGFTINDTTDYQDLNIQFPEKIAQAIISKD
ncbi:unnamed protein product [Kluyveromyces dobzhanskii CBS 2104]|uniref:Condensin complex subunit 2 n=1 Tax=Kluyveromyces dobzhanskii CBS 2104 TaxID=1427455 RepID=A0A0A8L808_9SACH|nr:unnamed protein product [Kluyveromyces dobzhanskii CBS 2104]